MLPGDLGFDPFSLSPDKDEQVKSTYNKVCSLSLILQSIYHTAKSTNNIIPSSHTGQQGHEVNDVQGAHSFRVPF